MQIWRLDLTALGLKNIKATKTPGPIWVRAQSEFNARQLADTTFGQIAFEEAFGSYKISIKMPWQDSMCATCTNDPKYNASSEGDEEVLHPSTDSINT